MGGGLGHAQFHLLPHLRGHRLGKHHPHHRFACLLEGHRECGGLSSIDSTGSPGHCDGAVFDLHTTLFLVDPDAEGQRLNESQAIDHRSHGIARLGTPCTGGLGSGLRGHLGQLQPQRFWQHRRKEGDTDREVVGQVLEGFRGIDVIRNGHARGAD